MDRQALGLITFRQMKIPVLWQMSAVILLPRFHSAIRFSTPIPVPQRVRLIDMQVVLLWFESEQRQSPFVGAFEGLPGDVLLPFEAFEPPVAIIQKDAPALPVGLVDAARMPDSAVDEIGRAHV